MAKKKSLVRLSPGEMELMAMLWEKGPLTLALAHRSFGQYGRPIGYPTMQTRLNRLVEKGYVSRSTDRPAAYAATIRPEQVRAGHLDLLLEKLGSQSVVPLVAHLISERKLSSEEIEELMHLLEQVEKGKTHSAEKRP